MVLGEPLYARDYEDAKYVFNRAVEDAATASGSFDRLFYWLTYKGPPSSALEVQSYSRLVDDFLRRWDSKAVQDRVSIAITSAASPTQTAVITPNDVRASLEKAKQFLVRWNPLAVKMIEAKARVIKGRKPSANPRKTDPRTTENTGTCACCGQNVKLANGKIVLHGFTLRWGGRNGMCFGVGYSPVETGKDGIEAYLLVLRSRESELDRSISGETRSPDTPLTRTAAQPFRTVGIRLENMRAELRAIKSDIRSTERRIAEWKPRPLPS